jgi:CHAD domain-containing protein
MSYRFKKDEPVGAGIRRVFAAELASAADMLTQATPRNRDEAVHEARKSIKKARAALRLVRTRLDAIGERENRRLRNTGRQLSELRDAGAMIELVDSLKAHFSGAVNARFLAAVRRRLVTQKQAFEKRIGADGRVKRAAQTLMGIARRVESWPLDDAGLNVLRKGLARTFRDGRKALGRVAGDPSDANYHEWRKRVKDHWYHVRLLQGLSRGLNGREAKLKELSEWLGEDHNLAVMRDRLTTEPALYAGPGRDLEAFLGLLKNRQQELRSKAMESGGVLYGVKPRKLVQELERLVRARQAEGPRRQAAAAAKP